MFQLKGLARQEDRFTGDGVVGDAGGTGAAGIA
jgi:hypothetical protein